jgi:O-antigen/teichoic acid export membrane protein
MNIMEMLEIEYKVNYNMLYVMIFNTIDSLSFLAIVIIMPFINAGLEFLVLGYVFSNLPGFIGLMVYLWKKYDYIFRFNLSQALWLLKEAFPLYGTVLLTALFQQADILLLKSIDTTHSVGIYAAATRLTTPLGIIPLAIITTAFPIIVKKREDSNFESDLTTRIVYKTLFLFAFLFSLIISFRAQDFILIIFGTEYVSAYIPLIVLFWSFLFVFFNTFSINLLTAFNLQKFNFYYTLILVTINILLLFLLISDFSYVGASIAKFGASFSGAIFFIYILNKFKISHNFLSLRILLWSITVAIIIFFLSYLPLYLYLLFALISVFYITLKTQFFNLEELDLLLRIINKSHWKKKIVKIV